MPPGKSRFETKDVLLAISILVTVVLGVMNYHQFRVVATFEQKQKSEQQKFERELKLEAQRPRLTQGYLILSGRALKQVAQPTGQSLSIEGFPAPQILDTDIARVVLNRVAKMKAVMALDDISVEFLAFTNVGKSRADMLRLHMASGETLDAGPVDPNTTKLLALSFRESEQGKERRESRHIERYSYTYAELGAAPELSDRIRPKALTSLIPTVGSMSTVAAAMAEQPAKGLLAPRENKEVRKP